jgi:ATP-dependent Clp protease ATP-binding subunit ClpX
MDSSLSEPTSLGEPCSQIDLVCFLSRFIGRVPVLAPLHPLSLTDLMRILVEPKNAIIKQQRKLFSRWDCELQFSETALKAIAKEALRRGGSARHLKSVISELLLDANYESPGSVSFKMTSLLCR